MKNKQEPLPPRERRHDKARICATRHNTLGSDTQITDQAGGVLGDLLYYPWGEAWQTAGTRVDAHFAAFQKAGGDVYQTPMRSYLNTLGRWMSPDPLGGDVTNPQSLNRYAYVTNNPTTLTDPLGLYNPFECDPLDPIDCGPPSCYFGDPGDCPPCDPVFGCPPPPPGGGGRGGSSGGTGGGAPPPPSAPPAGQPPLAGGGVGFPVGVGNALLGFHLLCSQSTIGPPVNVRGPAACALYFLNLRLGAFPVLGNIAASGIVIAGSVTAIVPIAGVAGAGLSLPFAFSNQGFACIGGGGAVGTIGKAFNAGPITGGDMGSVRNILSGLSVSVGVQSPNPLIGAQGIENSSGLLYGPTIGTPGGSLSLTYSFCGSAP